MSPLIVEVIAFGVRSILRIQAPRLWMLTTKGWQELDENSVAPGFGGRVLMRDERRELEVAWGQP